MDGQYPRSPLYGAGSTSNNSAAGEQGARRVFDVGAYTRGAPDGDVYRPSPVGPSVDQSYYLPYANGAPKPLEVQPAAEPPRRLPSGNAANGVPVGAAGHAGGPPYAMEQDSHERAQATWLVPDGSPRYWPIWTVLFTLAACFGFAFMAGQYGQYQVMTAGTTANNQQRPIMGWGPYSLGQWLVFWKQDSDMSFDFEYLLAWGGRWNPSIESGQWWRIFSSIILHANFTHLISNMLVFLVLAGPLEAVYGPIRILLIFVASGLAGTFLSMSFEDTCSMYVGASGAVFGFIGLYITDTLINWESILAPLLRLLSMVVVVAVMLVLEYVASPLMPSVSNVSHLSHIGGLLAGLFVSFLFLPDFKDRRWRRARRATRRLTGRQWPPHPARTTPELPGGHGMPQRSCWGRNPVAYWLVWVLCAGVMLFFFAALPVYLWKYKLPYISCPAATI